MINTPKRTRWSAFVPCLLSLFVATQMMRAQTPAFTVIHTFTRSSADGAMPVAGVISDGVGNLYGTTKLGGAHNSGTVFEISAGGEFAVLHSFCACKGDGWVPVANLVRDSAGNLYGTTFGGPGAATNGTVFRLTPTHSGAWEETILYAFKSTGGYGPRAGLIRDASGDLYGTTYGFNNGSATGTVFKLTPSESVPWKETTLFTFDARLDGGGPAAPVMMDPLGNLYGTTQEGGVASHGVVFKLTPSQSLPWKETILHSFTAGADGGYPAAGLIDEQGNLYGTAQSDGRYDRGVVFKLSPSGSKWIYTVLYAFCKEGGVCLDGRAPAASLVRDKQGNLYGTTELGGDSDRGVVFKLDRYGNETVLRAFTGRSDGAVPMAGLLMYKGDLYGTTSSGGDPMCGCGTVFKITP